MRTFRGVQTGLALLLLLIAAAAARGQTAAQVTHLSTIGTSQGQFLGVVSLVKKSDGSFLPQTDIRFRPVGAGSDKWIQYSMFDARVRTLAQRRGDLAVLLDLPGLGPNQTQLRFIYNPLELGSRPIDIPGPAVPPGITLFDIAGGRNDDPMLAAGHSDGQIQVLSLAAENWTVFPALPDELLGLDPERIDLADAGGNPAIAARIDESMAAVLLLREGQWQRRDIGGLSEGDQLILIDGTANHELILYVWGAQDRLFAIDLETPDASPTVIPVEWKLHEDVKVSLAQNDPRAASMAVGAIRLIRGAIEGEPVEESAARRDGGDEVLIELALDAHSLEPIGEGHAVPLRLAAMSPEEVRQQIVTLLLYALLVVAVVTVLRQKPMPAPERLKDVASHLAPLSLRVAAGLVDALPLLIILGIWYNFDDRMGVPAEWVLFGAGALVYFGHLILAEWLTGRSLGKVIFSLKVVRTDGTAPGLWAIILRNILRPLDVATFGVTLVMAMLTPLRQRLGDMAAATTVVQTRREK